MSATSIEWTDRSLNICRGCDAVSSGCLNCYAARMAARFARPGSKRGKLAVWTDKPVTLVPEGRGR